MNNEKKCRAGRESKNFCVQFFGLLFTIIMIMCISAGCSTVNMELMRKAEEKINEAQKNHDAVVGLKVEKQYSDEFAEASQELDHAKDYLKKKEAEKALPAAENSVTASKDILNKYYLDEVAPRAEAVKKAIMKKVGNDVDSPLKKYIPRLDKVLGYGKKLEANLTIASIEKIIKDIAMVEATEHVADTAMSKKLESDVSFGIGSYDLSEEGKSVLYDAFLRKIIADKEGYKRKYPDKTIRIEIKVVGYTDGAGFKNSDLIRRLSEGVENQVPQENIPHREFLNKRLSEFRARSVSEYLRQTILSSEGKNSQVEVKQEIVGKGENIPPGIIPSGNPKDSTRRICKIYSHYMIH